MNVLNAVGQSCGLETKKLSELPTHIPFRIIKIRKLKTAYGDRVLCVCENFETFLPIRFNDMSESVFDEVNNAVQPVHLIYEGFKNNRCMVRFN